MITTLLFITSLFFAGVYVAARVRAARIEVDLLIKINNLKRQVAYLKIERLRHTFNQLQKQISDSRIELLKVKDSLNNFNDRN